MTISAETKATLYGLTAVLLWSTVATAFKLSLEHYTPSQLLLCACAISAVIFWLAAIASGTARWPGLREAGFASLLGLINPAAYYLVLFEAYDRLPAQIAQPLNYTWAITLALLAVPVLKQRLSRQALAGIVVAYIGVVVLLQRGDGDGSLDATGVALALASTVLWAAYWLANTRINMPGAQLMAYSFTVALLPLSLWCAATDGWPSVNEGWPYVVWVGVVEMGFAFLLWQQALRLTSHVARISQLIFLSPFLSLLFIGSVLGEAISLTTIIGLAVIVVGVVLTQSASAR